MNFKPIITAWESEDGRFRITQAIPSGFCATDTWSTYDWGTFEYDKREFTTTFEEAVEWCRSRAK